MRQLLLCVVLGAGCSGTKEQPKEAPGQSEKPVAKFNYEELKGEYVKQPINADVKYKGKFVEVTGPVFEMSSDTIGFSAPPSDRSVIICRIDPAHKAEFVAVKRGLPFTLIGRVVGSHQDEITETIVTLDKCRAAK